MSEKTHIVYKITNLINNKIYVGLTSMPLKYRWKQHTDYASMNGTSEISKAIRQFGKENFKCEILETFFTNFFAKAGEIYWMDKLQTNYKLYPDKGYNMMPGGNSSCDFIFNEEYYVIKSKKHKGKKQISQYDLDGNFIRTYESLKEATQELGKGNVSRDLFTSNHQVGGFLWRYTSKCNDLKIKPYERQKSRERQINQYDLQGNFIRTFRSLTEASKLLKIGHTKISLVCSQQRKSAGKFQWRYKDDVVVGQNSIIKYVRNIKNKQKINQYDLQGNLIATYLSINDAYQSTKIRNISGACADKRLFVGNFIWRYVDNNKNLKSLEEIVNEIKTYRFKCRQINQYDKLNNFIRSFNSIKEASQIVNINVSQIGWCCRKLCKYAGGFIWRYVDNDEFQKEQNDVCT